MKIKVLMITYNRPDYTQLSLKRLCETAPENLRIVIWDNGSNYETKRVINTFKNCKCIERIILNDYNEKLRRPTNWFWENNYDADLIGKVDDDCLVPKNWCETLVKAHKDIPEAGIIGCWRFLPNDFNSKNANKKILHYGGHKIMRNCWIEGSGYLMKRSIIDKLGILKKKETFTDYCIRAAAIGYINGWYYPFLFQEHMDDPRAPNTGIKTEEDFQRLIPLSAKNFGIKNIDQWDKRLRQSAQRLQQCSIDPFDYIGLKALIKKKLHRLTSREYFPKIK